MVNLVDGSVSGSQPAAFDFSNFGINLTLSMACIIARQRRKIFSPSAHNLAFPECIGSIWLAYLLRHRTLFTAQCNNLECQLSLLLLILNALFNIK